MKTAIVTDSTAYIPKEVRNLHNIHIIPLTVVLGNDIYEEEIDLNADEFYEKVKTNNLPTTSQPPIGKFVELFEKLSVDYDEVISIHLSSGISGTYQGAVSAGTMVDGITVYAFDSEISCMIQGFYTIEAAKLAQSGKSAAEIMPILKELKQTGHAYFMVDDLSHLQRGGRLSSAQALIGSLLQMKPLLHFSNNVIVPFEKIRTKKRAIKRMTELFAAATNGESYQAVIIHANRKEEAEAWKQELAAVYPNIDFTISYFGAVIGTHLGEGAMGIGWVKKL
ncbi:DegV family protein [Niallia sp. 01092]|uniref:DegV family protein n=1 Tax=unclassified Niallia TaxID=2837522 RepID=UPI003FD4971D